MNLFNNLIEDRLKIKKDNRCNSVADFADYLTFLGHIGRINDIYISLRILDKSYVDNNQSELVKNNVYKTLESLIKKIEVENTYDIKKYFLNEDHEGLEVYNSLSSFIDILKNKEATPEDNFILNFLLNTAITKNVLSTSLAIRLVEHFWNAKNSNSYRKDYCVFSIVDYCIRRNNLDFFKLLKQYCNHIHKIYSVIYNSSLLTSDEKLLYQTYFDVQIRKSNNLKSKTKNRVAVCVSGLYRNHTNALESIKKNIVEPLNADVFVHTWDEKAVWNGIAGNTRSDRLFGSNSTTLIPREIDDLKNMQKFLPETYSKIKDPISNAWDGNEITNILLPKKIIIENQKDFEDSLIDKENYTLARGNLNQIKMFYGIKQSFDLAFENGTYDYIIRIRPDILVENKLKTDDIEALSNTNLYAGFGGGYGIDDTTFVMSSSMAHNLSDFITKMFVFNCLSPYDDFPLYSAHNLFLSWLLESNYHLKTYLLKKRLLNMSDRKISIEGLTIAVEQDFNNLSDDNKVKFLPFIQYLKTNYCQDGI